MNNYLGEELVEGEKNPFSSYSPDQWALKYIMAYGGFDQSYHKDWVLDQVARILNGTPVIVTLARWHSPDYFEEERYAYDYVDEQNHVFGEYRYNTGEATQAYHDWVLKAKGAYDEDNDEYEYSYSEGIAP
jgi:hypothetical protein